MKARKYLDVRLPHLRIPIWWPSSLPEWRSWLPSHGNVVFTLAMIALLVLAQSVGALPLGRPQAAPDAASTGTIAYQGRLADASGAPLTGTYNMIFRLYTVATGGTPLWTEQWIGPNAVRVSDGLFNVMLGSLTTLPQSVIAGRNQLFLGITVGTDDEMAPRVQLGSVPFAVQALTVPDGSITQAKLAPGVTGAFGGRPNSYPYVLHLNLFALYMGNFCWGYVPGDPAISSDPNCTLAHLNRFTSGLKLYVSSGNGYISAANNLPWLQVDFGTQTTTSSPRWGYTYSFFLNNPGAARANNPGAARAVQLPVTSCNDIAIYVSSGTVAPDQLGDAISLQYHRFPGNSGNDLLGCPCANLDPTVQIPAGAFRLTLLTRGAACTSYGTIGSPTTNWIRDAGLTIDWSGLRTYLGEQ